MTNTCRKSEFGNVMKVGYAISLLLFFTRAGFAICEGVLTEKKPVNVAENLKGNGIMFTPNKGQVADMNGKFCADVLYKSEGNGADIYLRKTGISYTYTNMGEVMHNVHEKVEDLIKAGIITEAEEQAKQDELMKNESIKVHRVDMDFEGANPNTILLNEDEVEGYQNYYYSHCPEGVTNVHQYNKVTYKNIYNNIDITYYGDKQNGIKYDLIVQPHADPNQIKLSWKGAEGICINGKGNLVIKTSVNEFYESMPKVYQNINGKITDVNAEYILDGTMVKFKLAAWNPEYPLVIDPWLSYYGGNNREEGISVTTDKTGNVVFIGNTISANFPTTGGATQISLASAGFADIFVVKMGAAGNRLWATYYGGTDYDGAGGVTCDGAGNVLVSGGTSSVNFPVSAVSHQTINGGGGEAFLIQFDPGGVRQWATYYGGTSSDWSSDVVTDGANIYLYGRTSSPNAISTAGAFQVGLNAGGDAFVAKFTSAGSRIWATYIGGSKSETSTGIDCDIPSGNIFITGYTNSANYPLLNPGGGAYFQGFGSCPFPNIGFGCGNNSYVSKFSSIGVLLWSTYYGATNSGGDYAWGMTVDFAGNAIISGYTYSANLPIGSCCGNIVQQAVGGGQKGFLVKFNSAGVRQWATFLGGNQPVQAYSTAVDVNNNIYFVGEFEDANAGTYPISTCAYQTNFGGGPAPYPEDQFIAKYNPIGKQLCITYLGGSGEDDMDGSQSGGGGISVYGNVLYITGITTGGYPVTAGAFQTIYAGPVSSNVYTGGGDAFISQLCINICEAKVLGLSYTVSTTNVCTNLPITFTPAVSNSCDTTGYKFHWTFTGGSPASSTDVKPVVSYAAAGNYTVKLVLTTACKKDSIVNSNYITVTSCGGITVTATSANVCSGTCATVTSNGSSGTGPYTYLWSNGSATQSINQCPSSNTVYTVTVIDNTGATATSTALITVNPAVSVSITPTNIICSGGSTGSAAAAGGGGTPAYTYTWSNLVSGSLVSGLSAGNYTVTVTDSKGCTSTSTTTIFSPPALTGQFAKGTAVCAGCGCKEWLMVNASGGTGPYSYIWPDGYINRYKNQLCPGMYTINIKDKNGCSVSVNLTTP